ncbi:transglycosylase family protein [Actinomadura vinacea]|uniref:transglycosylase family protein n=1 Tax=Actinomadura vinacea TaxID=115336 RepID=UPI0031D076C4
MRRPPTRSALSLLVTAALLAGCGGEKAPSTSAPSSAAADAPRPSATPRKIVLMVDKKKSEVMSAGATVEQVLSQARVALGPYDLVSPPRQSPPGEMIKVVRLLSKPVTKTVKTSAPPIRKKSSKVAPFSEKVMRKGKPGMKVVQIAYVRRRGKKVKAVISEQVKRKPVAAIVAVGPKGASTGSAARLNWAGLAKCESGGNPKAVNPAGYYGLYQFSMQTWGSVGGSGKPSDASAAEQTYRAQLLYNKVNGRWQGQWPNCGSNLFG